MGGSSCNFTSSTCPAGTFASAPASCLGCPAVRPFINIYKCSQRELLCPRSLTPPPAQTHIPFLHRDFSPLLWAPSLPQPVYLAQRGHLAAAVALPPAHAVLQEPFPHPLAPTLPLPVGHAVPGRSAHRLAPPLLLRVSLALQVHLAAAVALPPARAVLQVPFLLRQAPMLLPPASHVLLGRTVRRGPKLAPQPARLGRLLIMLPWPACPA